MCMSIEGMPYTLYQIRNVNMLPTCKLNIPIIHHKHHKLRQCTEQVHKIRNVVILIINSWKINHVKVVNSLNAVQKRDRSALIC